MKAKNHPDLEIVMKKIKLFVKSGVFNPDLGGTNSSSMILNNLPDITQKEILDVGCGAGIIGIYCALHGAKSVLAIDIDEKATENTKENVKLNNVLNIKVLKSDLFEKVQGKFDYIFANLPISDRCWNLGMSTHDLLKKFLLQSQKYLKPKGRIYFTWIAEDDVGSTIKILKENNFKYNEKKEKRLGKTWHLFEVEK